MGQAVSQDVSKLSREAALERVFYYLAKGTPDDDDVRMTLANLMTIEDSLSKQNIAYVKQDFDKMDRKGKGWLSLEEYKDWNLDNLKDVSRRDFNMWCQGMLASKAWSNQQLQQAGILEMSQKKQDDYVEEEVFREEDVEIVSVLSDDYHDETKHIQMIVEGRGALIDWGHEDKPEGHGTGRLKAALKALGHFQAHHQEQLEDR